MLSCPRKIPIYSCHFSSETLKMFVAKFSRRISSKVSWNFARHFASQNRPEISQAANLTDIGTRRIFNEDHDIFRTSVRKFFADEVVPNASRWESEGQVSKEIWEKCGSFGLLGIDVPAEYGGSASDFLTSVIPIEEQMYTHFSGLGISLHFNIVQPYLLKYATEEQRKKFIPQMVAGKCITAIAMTEPGAGSDLQGIRTSAKKSGSDWILNGSKIYITNGYMCNMVIVVAITDPTAKTAAHGISLFMVEEGMPGFKKGHKLKKMGLHAQDTAELFFEDVRLPQSAVLGEMNHGFYYLMNELPRERIGVALGAQASCEAMFEDTRKFVIERKAFGRRLADLQVIQHKLAELKTEICIGRTFTDMCIDLFNQGRLDSSTASMAKYWLTDLQNKVAYECVQLHGGAGYMMEYPIARAYIDARVQPIYAGSNEIMKELIARKIVSQK